MGRWNLSHSPLFLVPSGTWARTKADEHNKGRRLLFFRHEKAAATSLDFGQALFLYPLAPPNGFGSLHTWYALCHDGSRRSVCLPHFPSLYDHPIGVVLTYRRICRIIVGSLIAASSASRNALLRMTDSMRSPSNGRNTACLPSSPPRSGPARCTGTGRSAPSGCCRCRRWILYARRRPRPRRNFPSRRHGRRSSVGAADARARPGASSPTRPDPRRRSPASTRVAAGLAPVLPVRVVADAGTRRRTGLRPASPR